MYCLKQLKSVGKVSCRSRRMQMLEETLLNLDDPRRPVDLREYQKLNSMQDDSMAELDGNFAHH